MRSIVALLLVLGCIGTLGQSNPSGKPLTVRAIYPAGTEVAPSDRITIEFNQRVVALGTSMFVDDVVPIAIEPELECEWNWVKLNTLQCELPIDSNLDTSTKYTVRVSPGIKSPSGHMMDAEYVHTFETITPKIRNSRLVSWKSPTEPILEIWFNQTLNLDSLQDRLFLYDSNTGREIPTKICPDTWRRSSALKDDFFGRQKTYQIFDGTDCDFAGKLNDNILLLPQEPLSFKSGVALQLLPGVQGAKGNLTSQDRVLFDAEVTTYSEKFRMLGVLCQNVYDDDVFVPIDQSQEETCDVQSDFVLVFSSRFKDRSIEDVVHLQPPTHRDSAWLSLRWDWSDEFDSYKYRIVGDFKSNTLYQLRVATAKELSESTENPAPVIDGFGRALVGTNEIVFRTSRPAPRVYMEKARVVVDSNGSVDPKIYLGNVEDVTLMYDTLDEQGVKRKQLQHRPSPEQDNVIEEQFLGLRNLLRSRSGVMSGKIVSRPRFDHPEDQLESHFFAQATPYSVFLKLGPTNTLAWVVDLQTGEPVRDADVELYLGNPNNLAEIRESLYDGSTDKDGFVSFPRYESFDPRWNRAVDSLFDDCRADQECPMYFLQVQGDVGMALIALESGFMISGSTYRSSIYRNLDHWAATAQNLYMPGDTVHIKGYVRTRRNEIQVIPDHGEYALCVRGPESREYEVFSISLNEFGAYHTSLKLGEKTEFGEYDIYIVYDPARPVSQPCVNLYSTPDRYAMRGGSFEVFEFKTNPLQVSLELNAEEFERGDDLVIMTQAELHAGGPYAHAEGQVVVTVRPEDPPFTSVSKYLYTISRNHIPMYLNTLYDVVIELDDDGKQTSTVKSLDSSLNYGELRIESSVISDRGKSVVNRVTAPYFGVDQFVAIRQPRSFETMLNSGRIRVGESWPIEVLVLSKDDTFVTGKDVQIRVHAAKNDSGRKELGLYSPTNWQEIFECELVSTEDPVSCDFIPPEANVYRITAQIVDTKGNTHESMYRVQALVNHPPRVEPKAPQRERMTLICASREVEVGELVRCEVKNHSSSFPALVTVERSSVLDKWLVRLDPKRPYIEFEVLEEYAPRFELSVLEWSPTTVSDNTDDTLYQIATAEFSIEDPRTIPLEVAIASNRQSYAPRDSVKLTISAKQPRRNFAPVEYAIAVVDQSLLDLSSTSDTFFDPTKKTWKLNETSVRTYGLIAKLMTDSVTRSTKTTPYSDYAYGQSGGGLYYNSSLGSSHEDERTTDPNVRNVDRFVAYWNPSLVAYDGRLNLEFVLPDNLTRWRVLVMAVTNDDRFGFATSTFSSSKDTEVRAIVPNVVTEGDKFQIGASILNRAKRRRSINVELQASGLLVPEAQRTFQKKLRFKPFERKVVIWDVEAGILPKSLDPLQPISTADIRVIASAGDRRDEDAIKAQIPVRSRRIRVSSIVYGTLEGDRTILPIEIPTPLAKEDGLLDFTLTTNDTPNFDGVFRYAIEYPYSCWEQKLTQALLAMQYVQLEKRGAQHGVEWSDPEGLIARVLEFAIDFQAPNGGMAYFTPRNRYVGPYLSAYTAIAFSWLEEAGYETPVDVKRKLLDYLRDFLTQEEDEPLMADWISDQKQFDRIQATVSAVVVHALAIAQRLTKTELVQYSRHINQLDLFGLSHYFMAALRLDPTDVLVPRVFERIMNHRSLVDGAVEFVESVPYEFTRILHSDTRTLCTVLEALTKYSDHAVSGIEIGELKELSNSVQHARNNSPHWRNTQDNVFCTNALLTFYDFLEADIGELSATVDLRSDETGVSTRLVDGWQMNASVTRLHTQQPLQAQHFGSKGAVEINRLGTGHAFYNVEVSYLTTVNEKINRFSGFEIHREYVVLRDKKWQILKEGDHVNKGEYVVVHLFLNNRFDRHHVVLDDAVPGGLEPINDKLRTEYLPGWDRFDVVDVLPTSRWYSAFHSVSKGWDFRYRELGLQNVRFYARSIDRGRHHLSWSAQAINAGEFTVLPTHVEEMYRPIMFGKSEPWTLLVKP